MNQSSYQIKLDQFEGPFDLLLFFIERDELDIYNIPITRIINDFLEFIHQSEKLNIELSSEFILFVSTLMRIKARLLLPRKELDAAGNEIDPRQELIDKILEYKKFKEAAAKLRDHEAMQQNLFARVPAMPNLPPAENLLVEEVGIFDLIHAFQKILKRIDSKKEDLREIFAENYTVSDKMDHVLRITQAGVPLRFEELFADAASRTEIVVTFLAMLELIRLKQLRVRQDGDLGEIWIDRISDAQPYFS